MKSWRTPATSGGWNKFKEVAKISLENSVTYRTISSKSGHTREAAVGFLLTAAGSSNKVFSKNLNRAKW